LWDGLPPDIRTTLEGALKDTSTFNDQIAKKDSEAALVGMKASGEDDGLRANAFGETGVDQRNAADTTGNGRTRGEGRD
jgi:hypothetical protein